MTKPELGEWTPLGQAPILGDWKDQRRVVGWIVRQPDGEYALRNMVMGTDPPDQYVSIELALMWVEVYLQRPPEYTKEDAISEVLARWSEYSWYWDVREFKDSGGLRLEILVDDETYPKSDPLPRRVGPPREEVYMVVTRIDTKLAKPPPL